jgi:group I intron endonuclease
MFYIYVIQNKIDLKIYVGQTNDPKIRWNRHKSMSKGKSKQYIHNAIRFHGIENFLFQTIEEFESEMDINEAEEFWIGFFQSRNREFGYNLTDGGYGSRGLKHSESSIKKMSKTHSLFYEDPIARLKQSEAAILHYQENPDTVAKISSSLKNYYKNNVDAAIINSEAVKKYYVDNVDAKKKNSLSKKKNYSSETIIEIRKLHDDGLRNIDISKKLTVPVGYISKVITGKIRNYE